MKRRACLVNSDALAARGRNRGLPGPVFASWALVLSLAGCGCGCRHSTRSETHSDSSLGADAALSKPDGGETADRPRSFVRSETSAPGSELPPPPKDLSALYSKQLYFRDGTPVVPVRLMEGQEVVTVVPTGPTRLTVGDLAIDGIANATWTIRLVSGEPARLLVSVQLAEVPFTDNDGLATERTLWQQRGLGIRTLTTGTLYGVRGKVIDNRRHLLLLDRPGTRVEAEQQQELILKRYGRETLLFEETQKRAHGVLELADFSGRSLARGENQVVIETLDQSPIGVRRVELGVGYDFHSFEDRLYRGSVEVTVDRLGKLAVVNLLSLEDLLRGLVPAEMFPKAPIEALKAQAVTARAEVLAKIGTRHLADPYFLCAEQHCAVYRGLSGETAATNMAVQATRGIALFSPEGHLVNSVYSAVCGGHTENNEAVWGGPPDPHLRGKPDLLSPTGQEPSPADLPEFLAANAPAACRLASWIPPEKYRWTRRFSNDEMNGLTKSLQIGPVEAIAITERGASGRARAVTVSGHRSAKQVRGELQIRKLFGMLNSSMFLVEAERGSDGQIKSWNFRGGGWGHGVGMCQMGAIGRAEAGQNYRAILRHYFSGAEPASLY